MRGSDPLPPSPQLIALYIADLAAPQGRIPALSVSSIEGRLSGLAWGYAQRDERLDRKDRHIATVLAGIHRQHSALGWKSPVAFEQRAAQHEHLTGTEQVQGHLALRNALDDPA